MSSKIKDIEAKWVVVYAKLMGAIYESCHESRKPLGDCVRVVKLLNCFVSKMKWIYFFKKNVLGRAWPINCHAFGIDEDPGVKR